MEANGKEMEMRDRSTKINRVMPLIRTFTTLFSWICMVGFLTYQVGL